MSRVRIELVPDPGAEDPAVRAVAAVLASEGLLGDGSSAGYDSAWRRAGLEDDVGRSAIMAAEALPASAAPPRGYVPPVRSSRGATRA